MIVGGEVAASVVVVPGDLSVINRVYHGLLAYNQSAYALDPTVSEYYISYTINAKELLNSDYAFTMLIDTPEVRTFSLHGGGNDFSVFIPFGGSGVINNLPSFADDQDYEIEHFIDFQNDSWSINIDGVERYRSSINASSAENLRFSMSPWTATADADAPDTTVEISNFVIHESFPGAN